MAGLADEYEIAQLTLQRVAHEHSVTGDRVKSLAYWERRVEMLEAQLTDQKIDSFQEAVAMSRLNRRLVCFGESNAANAKAT